MFARVVQARAFIMMMNGACVTSCAPATVSLGRVLKSVALHHCTCSSTQSLGTKLVPKADLSLWNEGRFGKTGLYCYV